MTYDKKKKILGLNDILTFGKWKDSTIEEVIGKDVSYITWCISEGIFELDQEADTEYNYSALDEDNEGLYFNENN